VRDWIWFRLKIILSNNGCACCPNKFAFTESYEAKTISSIPVVLIFSCALPEQTFII